MLQSMAVRNQLILPQQQAIFDYWLSLCVDGRIPCRNDIDPSRIIAHLPMLSITYADKQSDGMRFQCRLMGTGFWDLYEEEVQGRYIDELPIGDRKNYWQRILSAVVERKTAMAGVTRPGTPFGAYKAQFWVRMPLSSEPGGEVDLVLGFDHMMNMSEAMRLTQENHRVHA